MTQDVLEERQGEASPWKEMRAGRFLDRIGPLLAARDDGAWRYGLRVDDSHTNPVGLVHGGVIFSLIDHAIALVAWEAADRHAAVTLQLDTRFLETARAGDLLEAGARLRHRTHSLLFLDADVTVGGRPIAAASAIMKLAGKGAGHRDER
ncbi:PaaI family thioesterase [Polymorphum gilvum]|uniref:Thioesterase superfamily protein n=1 Tax=Polymorphum gilvum (strain LMG 25793 / CGMCC 1.9160 / SL003B-26A1) TaxID=991905 RepID=F2IWY8_POLGS|nr:PaaI family thioesterase [Polymorphum gilvum]ADZ71565.1 Thioesterase superfamily protein [Polymorphum gilvum SL003B-26A1]